MIKTNPAFMTGVPEILVLRLLAEHEMYGYELVQAVEAATNGAIQLGEGVVYPMLHALEQRRCLRSHRKPVNGRTRVYYSITPLGRRRLEELKGEWVRITDAVAHVLGGGMSANAGA